MTITAKYHGSCSSCGRAIDPGQAIEWARGSASRHAACGQSLATARPGSHRRVGRVARPAGRPAAQRARKEGEQEVSRPSKGRDDGYTVGATSHFHRVAGGGGPDGRYWTVTAAGKRRITEAEDDTREGEWACWAHVRPATETEAAPVAARRAASESRAQLASDLNALRGERTSDPMPVTAAVLVPRDTQRLCATGERVAIVDGAILHERVGDPDMCDSWYHYVVRIDAPAELVARIAAFAAAAKEA